MTVRPDAREANQAYWESDASVADIAARFDLSRRALYETVEPLDTGVGCSACGGALRFENRLARRTGSAVCSLCGAHQHVDAADIVDGGTRRLHAVAMSASQDDRAASDYRSGDPRHGELRNRAVLLGSAAIAGMAIGGVAAWLARRRD